VIVYFEVEGPVEMHHVEGLWKNPAGKVSTISDFSYTPGERQFSFYCTLALGESAETGTWLFEAHIDGNLVGVSTFQIIAGSRPASVLSSRKLLSPTELYQRTVPAMVTIDKIGPKGERRGTGSGFIAAPSVVLSAFQCIDGASKLRIIFADGSTQETDQLLSWNRRQDWAAISVDTKTTPPLKSSSGKAGDIGAFALYLDTALEGNRVLSEVKIIGKSSFASNGERLQISNSITRRAIGAPLLDEYGEVIGILGGSIYPGMSAVSAREALFMDFMGNRQSMAVPIDLVTIKQADSTSIEDLVLKGEVLPVVVLEDHISNAQLARSIDKSGFNPWPKDPGLEFSRKHAQIVVFMTWDPKEKLRGLVTSAIYDLDGKLISRTSQKNGLKINLKPGKKFDAWWQVDVAQLPVGVYRIDVLLEDAIAWRYFFRIVD
jgi:S1-C subfamily serine protease